MSVKTLQYAVVNLDYNSLVGLNYVGVTHQVNNGKVINAERDSNDGMYWVEGNLDRDGGSNFTSIGASHASNNGSFWFTQY